jgi:hypothetical protein
LNFRAGSQEDDLIKASCHCGAVGLEIDAAPTQVTDCNCSICRRYGALWAYYAPKHVRRLTPDAATDVYRCHDKALEFHRCSACGCVAYWASSDPQHDWMGVNARLMEPEILAPAKVRRLDGADTWTYLGE